MTSKIEGISAETVGLTKPAHKLFCVCEPSGAIVRGASIAYTKEGADKILESVLAVHPDNTIFRDEIQQSRVVEFWLYPAEAITALLASGEVVLRKDVEELVETGEMAVTRMKEFPGLNCDTEEVIIWLNILKDSGQALQKALAKFTTKQESNHG